MITESEKHPNESQEFSEIAWVKAAPAASIPENGGACVKFNDHQIAVFNFTRRSEWYACQNLCPHKMQMALSRGMIGSCGDEPKVACPFHKKTFSLKDGKNLNGDDCAITVYPIKVEEGFIYIGLEGKAK